MTNPTSLRANKGQAAIESALALPIVIAFIFGLIFASYRALVYFYADAALHEAMICTDSSSTSQCENEFEKHIGKVLLKNETVEIVISKSGSGKSFKLYGKVLINPSPPIPKKSESSFWQTKILIKKEMKFPLKG